MTCSCIKELEEKLKARVQEPDFSDKRPKNGKLTSLLCQNIALVFGIKVSTALNIPFVSAWELPGKNGPRRKEVVVNVMASHCPFCGKNLKEKSEP